MAPLTRMILSSTSNKGVSLIDTNGAYQLAKRWLTILGVDVVALEDSSGALVHGGHTIRQARYLPPNATNVVTLPIFHVDFGSQHYPANPKKSNLRAFDTPLTTVEILGSTKELQQIRIGENTLMANPSYYHGHLLLITNALELIHTPNPTPEELRNPATAQAYFLTPQQVLSYTSNYYASARTNSDGQVYYRLAHSTNQDR